MRFLLLSSNRVRSDLKWMLSYEEEFWDNKLVFREWIDIPLSMEFRTICVDKKITAISQYAHDLYFHNLAKEASDENRDGKVPTRIIKQIYDTWEKVKEDIPFDYCIIDFAILENDTLIIEINPLVS